MRRWLAVPLLLFGFASAHAATVLNTTVTHEDDHYYVKFDVRVRAEAGKVRMILTNFSKIDRLSDTIVDQRVLETRPDGSQRVQLTFRACVLFFCRTMQKTTDVRVLPNGDIYFRTEPQGSDFSYGRETWHLEPKGQYTQIQYNADLVPAFFVPPVIGPWLVKIRITDELKVTANRIEEIARTG